MCQWILKANGSVVPRLTVRPLNAEERHGPINHKKREIFKELIIKRWGTSINKPPPEPLDNDNDWDKGDGDAWAE
jgi:hypothetical protein